MIRSVPSPLRSVGALALAGALAVAGCGGSVDVEVGPRMLDVPELERNVADDLERQVGARPEIDCPQDEIEIERGARFTCELTAPNGDTRPVDIELTDDEGGYHARVR